MKLCDFCVLFIVISMSLGGDTYRILGMFPFNGKSHYLMFDCLIKELVARGHQVDVVSHYPLKKPLPNYNDVVSFDGTVPHLLNNMSYEFGTKVLGEASLVVQIATQFGSDLCDLMDLPQFKKFIHNPPKDPPYDIIITEFFGSPCYFALGQHLNAPVVGVITSPMWPWANDVVGNPDNPSYIPHIFSGLAGELNFWERIVNTVTLLRAKWQYNHHTKQQDEQIKKYFGPHAPSVRDAMRNISLILVNSHYSLHGVRPFTTAVVEVGGLHVREDKTPLQNELQNWLDDCTNGFVFVSFGSMLKIETFPNEKITAIYYSLEKLAPIRVLIKVVNAKELPPGLPSNVLTLPWIPQIAVLQHKNIRAFVTHGGLMGTQEAVYFGVPMIGIPVFGDQAQNMDLYVQKKIAVTMRLDELSEKNLDAAFNAVLHDPSYIESAKRMSAEFRDRPMSAMDTAIFWIEYVVRNGGKSIRSHSLNLEWWQISLLDVYGALLVAGVLGIYLLRVIIYKIMVIVSGSGVRITLRTKKSE